MGFNVPKQQWGYKRSCSGGLRINFNHLKFLNVHINLTARMFLPFVYIDIQSLCPGIEPMTSYSEAERHSR